MNGHTTDLILLGEFVVGLLFIAGLYVYQGWATRRLDAVSVLFAVTFVVLAVIFSEVFWVPRWEWVRERGDLQPYNRAVFAVSWNLLLLALVRELWQSRRNK